MTDETQAELLRQVIATREDVAGLRAEHAETKRQLSNGLTVKVAEIHAIVSAHPQPCPFIAYQAEHPEATEPGRALARRKSDRMRTVWRVVFYVLGGGAAAMSIVGGILTILDRLGGMP